MAQPTKRCNCRSSLLWFVCQFLMPLAMAAAISRPAQPENAGSLHDQPKGDRYIAATIWSPDFLP